MIYLNQLKDGEAYQEIYLIKSVNKSVTSTNKTFLTLVLQDKTGVMNAKKWDVTSDDLEIFKAGKFVNISFDVTTYKEKLELKIRDARAVEVTKLDDYIPTSPIPKETLTEKLESFLAMIKDPGYTGY